MIKEISKILYWVIDKYDKTKEIAKEFYRLYNERRIDKAVDNHNIDTIHDVVRNIKEKRDKRRDQS